MQPAVAVRREDRAMNEFTANNLILISTFPHLFPLGNGPARVGSMATADSRHLLLQYNPAFGSCAQLIFLLFNQLQRHGALSSLAAAVRNNDAAFAEFKELAANDSTLASIEAALASPAAPASKALIIKLDRILRIFNRMVPFSAAARKAKLGDFTANVRHFGHALFFNTVSPDPVGNLGLLRGTHDTFDNHSFPATEDGYVANVLAGKPVCYAVFPPGASVAEGQRIAAESPTTYGALLARACTHAAAAAEGFRQDISALFRHVYGLPLVSETRRTLPREDQAVGALGATSAFVSATECNGRGWLHNHHLVWTGIPSWMLQAACLMPELRAPLAEFVEACVSAELTPTTHVQSLLRRAFGFEPFRGPWTPAPPPPGPDATPAEAAVYELYVQLAAERTQLHLAHSSRCHKGNAGVCWCAMSSPRGLRCETAAVELNPLRAGFALEARRKP